jgi:hypothetical protein
MAIEPLEVSKINMESVSIWHLLWEISLSLFGVENRQITKYFFHLKLQAKRDVLEKEESVDKRQSEYFYYG